MKRIIKNLSITGAIFAAIALVYLELNLPPVAQLQDVRLQVPLQIYSSDNKIIATFGAKFREPIAITTVPPQLLNAIIATEDVRFYQHYGIDLRSLIRALVQLIKTGSKDQGASTITMQVARNFFLGREKTYFRKIKEMLLAINIEFSLTKQEILELYCNKIFFGKRAYGIAAAAKIYYGVTVDKLTLAQMAMLAGLPQAPSAINPLNNTTAAIKRRKHVLDRMLHHDFIDLIEYTVAINTPLTAEYHAATVELEAPYVAEMVRQELFAKLGAEIYSAGYDVYTSIDSAQQNAANAAVTKALTAYQKRHIVTDPKTHTKTLANIQGALIAMQPDTGAITAMVGGYNDSDTYFNRATQAYRQPGSSFKPFIYAAALEQGSTCATIINDAPVVHQTSHDTAVWRPKNHTYKFSGPTRLRDAIAKSLNMIAIRLLETTGIKTTLNFAAKFGFEVKKFPHDLTLALGTCEITPMALATGYCSFANGGLKIKPYIINKITNYYGDLVFTAPAPIKERIIDVRLAYITSSLLQNAFKKVTTRFWRTKRTDLAGKTGSTNDHKDAWYAGFNRDLVTVVWVGFDNPQTLNEYSIRAAFPMWHYFMGTALQNQPNHILAEPAGIVTVRIDPKTGLLAGSQQTNAIYEIFRKENVPNQAAPNITNAAEDHNISELF